MSYPKIFNVFMMSILASATVALADPVDSSGAKCDTSLTRASLSSEEVKEINRAGLVARFVKQPNGFNIGYIFSEAKFDAELAMGVYSMASQHAGKNGLGDFIKQSKVLGSNEANPFRVYYEQQVDWPYDNGNYTVANTITKEQGGFYHHSVLLESSDAGFSPRWADGYVRVVPQGSGIFVVACNYMVPRTDSYQGRFNSTAHDRLISSGHSLLNWVSRVAGDSALAQRYRDRLSRMVK
jgi:hypothetical protein